MSCIGTSRPAIGSAIIENLENRRLLDGQPFYLTADSAPETISNAQTIGDFYSDPAIYTDFTLVDGEGSEGNYFFRIADFHLKPWMQLNYEVQNVFSIRVRATDADGNSVEQIFWLSITDVNEAPTSVLLSNSSVGENYPAHTLVGNLSATDPENNVVGFSLVGNSSDNSSFEIVGGQLRTTAYFDYETKSSYSITVRATDAGGLYRDQNFTISVIDGDDVPDAFNDYADTRGRSRMSINVLANDADPEGGALTVALGDLPTNGTVVLNSDGTFTYHATLGYIGTDSFTYTIEDSVGQTDTATVNIDVTIPSIPHIVVGGTMGADNMGLSVVDDVIRYQLEDFIRQFMFAGTQTITMLAHAGDDTVTIDDSMTLGVTVSGSLGNDTLLGGPGADWLMGCNGDDLVEGRAGDDSLNGGGGNDVVIGGDGNDLVIGTNGTDSLEGNAGDDRIYGGPLVDTILGGDGVDRLYGGRDNDLIYAGLGNDIVLGELDNDQIWGEAGNDTIRGNFGNDTIWGGEGGDRIYGDLDDDELYGEGSTDYLNGGPGNDKLYGGSDRDRLVGDAGDDLLDGGNNLDSLFGGFGYDQLWGQGGADLLQGGTEDDYLCGGDGLDTLRGDAGDDEFESADTWSDILAGGLGTDKATCDGIDQLFGIENLLA